MFDRLFGLLASVGEKALPWVIIDPYEQGVVLRLGRFVRSVGPGAHWRIPFIDTVLYENVVPKVERLQSQSIQTADGKSATVRLTATYRIWDIEAALLQVDDVTASTLDAIMGRAAPLLARSTWDEITDPAFSLLLTAECAEAVEEFGVEIIRVQLSDLTTARTFRLFME